MREVNLVGGKVRLTFRLPRRQPAPEEGELIAEVLAVGGVEVAGVIPPLGLEIVVRPVVARELEVTRRVGAGKAGDVCAGRQQSRRGSVLPGAGEPSDRRGEE